MLVLGTKSNAIFNINRNIKTKKKIKPVNWFGYLCNFRLEISRRITHSSYERPDDACWIDHGRSLYSGLPIYYCADFR